MAKARLIRGDIFTSDAFLDELSNLEQLCFLHLLIVIIDDFGNTDATDKELHQAWLLIGVKTLTQAKKILKKLIEIKYVIPYQANKYSSIRRHLHVPKFDQKKRWPKKDCEMPKFQSVLMSQNDNKQQHTKTNLGKTPSDDGEMPAVRRQKTAEVEVDVEVDVEKNNIHKILEHLNKVANKNFHYAKTHEKLIKERLKESSFEEIISVIDNQTNLWKHDPKMNQYLKPSTLFRSSNFQNYRGNLKQAESLQVAL